MHQKKPRVSRIHRNQIDKIGYRLGVKNHVFDFFSEYNKYVDATTDTETLTERLRMMMPDTPLKVLQQNDHRVEDAE